MKTIIYSLTLLVFTTLYGCGNDCCDCDKDVIITTGEENLRLVRNWDKLWEGMAKPDELDVYFYHSQQYLKYQKTYTDTTYFSLPNGEYTVLAISKTKNVTYTGMESYGTANISVPVWTENGQRVTSNAPLAVTTYESVWIDNIENSVCVVTPKSVVNVINFRFNISTDSLFGGVDSCKTKLCGVQTDRMLCTNTGKGESAILPFTTIPIREGVFDGTVRILGLSGKKDELQIEIVGKNQSIQAIVDLTDLFDFSLSPVQYCVIDLSVQADRLLAEIESISISDWEQGDDGMIHFPR